MNLFIGTIALYCLLWAVTAHAQTGVDVSDRILVAYKLAPCQEEQFNPSGSSVAAFWSEWGKTTLDEIFMTSADPLYAVNRSQVSPFSGADDAQMMIRVAYSDNFIYLYSEMEDNSWVDYANAWQNDAVDLYIDGYDLTGLEDQLNWFNPTQWALTFLSKQIQAGMQNASGWNYRYYDDLQMSITDHPMSFGTTIDIKVLDSDVTHKKIEMRIPAAEWNMIDMSPGKRYGFAGGYNDVDGEAAGEVNSLRWQGNCDQYCEPPSAATWGELELGSELPGADCSTIRTRYQARAARAPLYRQAISPSFYSIRGERITAPLRNPGNRVLVKQLKLADGSQKIEKVSLGVR